jgi:hypothetical protein
MNEMYLKDKSQFLARFNAAKTDVLLRRHSAHAASNDPPVAVMSRNCP